MKINLAILLFIAVLTVPVQAQTVATTANVLHPLMKNQKDPKHPHAISSLDRDPSLLGDSSSPATSFYGSTPLSFRETGKPAEIVAQIDPDLQATPLSLIGTVNGIRCSFFVTNTGANTVVPTVQLAVCDYKGFKIGQAVTRGNAIGPNEGEKIELLATNVDGADLKLMKLTSRR